MDFDAWLNQLTPADLAVAVLALLTAFAYLALLARAHARATLLLALAREVRMRRRRQEELLLRQGYAPRLEQYRRLDADMARRLANEGLRGD